MLIVLNTPRPGPLRETNGSVDGGTIGAGSRDQCGDFGMVIWDGDWGSVGG